jgi:hypothetical protein
VAAADDDAGGAGDGVDLVVTGTADDIQGPGFWQREYDPRKTPHMAEPTLACYLRIADQMSAVFGEARPVATRANAFEVVSGPGSGELDKLDRVLLGAWLNFADGSLRYDVMAPTLAAAEATRLDSAATKHDLQRARQEVSRFSG